MTTQIVSTKGPLVSVIMTAYNAEPYVEEAVRSALAQDHENIEVIVVNDGSTDNTLRVLQGVHDPRLRVLSKTRGGIGSGRNLALDHASGEFVCFLDADDRMPPKSVSSRCRALVQHPDSSFADGAVDYYDAAMERILRTYTPCFAGEPLQLLARLDRRCFFGNTWLIRWPRGCNHRFSEDLTHAEDLLFYLGMANGLHFTYTTETVLHYRVTGASSMSRLEGLERSYWCINRWLAERPHLFSKATVRANSWHIRRMMSGAYYHARRPWRAVLAWLH
jgi:teichuronic acid biosynthesis glycosyltransferase TuaG